MRKAIVAILMGTSMFGIIASGCAPEPGADCIADDSPLFPAECNGDDLYFCVCKNWVDNTCPSHEGRWVKQDIGCTCEVWMNDNASCPIE